MLILLGSTPSLQRKFVDMKNQHDVHILTSEAGGALHEVKTMEGKTTVMG